MSKRSGSLVVCLIVAAGWALAGPVSGFLIQTFQGADGWVQHHWQDPQRIGFVLHSQGPADLPASEVHQALRQSFQIWQDVPTALVSFVDQGVSSTRIPSQRDRRNLVYFDGTGEFLQLPAETGVIALTRIVANEFTGAIVDADIIFNDRDFQFTLDAGDGSNHIDLRDVAVHEIGHLLGLDHTPIGGTSKTRPTMHPFYYGNEPGSAQKLEADDIAAVSALYPAPGFAESTATISGSVVRMERRPVFGGHVIAEHLDTGALISTVSGSDPEAAGTGAYTLRGLAPGAHRIFLEPISRTITEENFGGVFTGFDTSFTTQYYDGVRDEDLATALTLAAGDALDGIDFLIGADLPGQPAIHDLTRLANTPDTQNPYVIEAHTSHTTRMLLRYRVEDQDQVVELDMNRFAPGRYRGQIPAQAAGSRVSYQLEASGMAGTRPAVFPDPVNWWTFDIIKLSGSPLAFAALRDEASVAVIDTEDMTEVARIPVGDEPVQVVLDTTGMRLFVASLLSAEIHAIDIRNFQVSDRYQTDSQPLDLALAPDGSRLYATCAGAGTVGIIDLATGSVRSVPVPVREAGPYGIAAAAERLFISDLFDHRVLMLDEQGAMLSSRPVHELPRSLALDMTREQLFVTSLGSGRLTVMDVTGRRLPTTIELPVGGTFAAALSPDGAKLYVTAHAENLVIIVDPHEHHQLGSISVGKDPRGLAFSPCGDRLYVTSAAANEITVVDTGADSVLSVFSTGAGPRGIAVTRPYADDACTVLTAPEAPVWSFWLSPAYPNPFNAETRFQYTLDPPPGQTADVDLSVFNTLGQHVATLVRAPKVAGRYTVVWNGTNAAGQRLSSGVYLVVLRANGRQRIQRALLLR